MLRKLIVFAITSGLAAKAWRSYNDKKTQTSASAPASGGAVKAARPAA